MTIVRGPNPTKNFTILDNASVRDDRLSWRARGLLVFLLSQPEGYRVRSEQLADAGKEGREAVRAALKELETLTYLVRMKTQGEDGKFSQDAVVYNTPQTGAGFPGLGLEVLSPGETVDIADKSPGETRDGLPGAGCPGPFRSTSKRTKRTGNLQNETAPVMDVPVDPVQEALPKDQFHNALNSARGLLNPKSSNDA